MEKLSKTIYYWCLLSLIEISLREEGEMRKKSKRGEMWVSGWKNSWKEERTKKSWDGQKKLEQESVTMERRQREKCELKKRCVPYRHSAASSQGKLSKSSFTSWFLLHWTEETDFLRNGGCVKLSHMDLSRCPCSVVQSVSKDGRHEGGNCVKTKALFIQYQGIDIYFCCKVIHFNMGVYVKRPFVSCFLHLFPVLLFHIWSSVETF